jgi:hypothetical protein
MWFRAPWQSSYQNVISSIFDLESCENPYLKLWFRALPIFTITMLDYFPHMSQCLSSGEDRIWSPLNKNTMHLFSRSLFFSLSGFQKKIGVYRTSAVRSFVCPSGHHTFSSLRHTYKFCSDGDIYLWTLTTPIFFWRRYTNPIKN